MGDRLAGKVAVITGSTSGIGRGTAVFFASEGAKVVLVGRRRYLGEEAAAEIRAAGGEAAYFQADFETSGPVRDTIRFALDTYGRIDVVMNNAMSHVIPWGDGKSAVEMTEDEWDRMMAVGLKASWITCQEAIPSMIEQGGGSIINIGSVRTFISQRRGLAYDTVKSGLIQLTRQVNVDFGRQGIRANLICPGWILTDPARAERVRNDPADRIKWEKLQTVGRAGWPIDIAHAALFFASDESTFVAGATLVVDGGMMCLSGFEVHDLVKEHYRDLYGGERAV